MPTQNIQGLGLKIGVGSDFYLPPISGNEVADHKLLSSVNFTEVVHQDAQNETSVHFSNSVQHHCQHFAFPPPPSDRKRIGPRRKFYV